MRYLSFFLWIVIYPLTHLQAVLPFTGYVSQTVPAEKQGLYVSYQLKLMHTIEGYFQMVASKLYTPQAEELAAQNPIWRRRHNTLSESLALCSRLLTKSIYTHENTFMASPESQFHQKSRKRLPPISETHVPRNNRDAWIKRHEIALSFGGLWLYYLSMGAAETHDDLAFFGRHFFTYLQKAHALTPPLTIDTTRMSSFLDRALRSYVLFYHASFDAFCEAISPDTAADTQKWGNILYYVTILCDPYYDLLPRATIIQRIGTDLKILITSSNGLYTEQNITDGITARIISRVLVLREKLSHYFPRLTRLYEIQ